MSLPQIIVVGAGLGGLCLAQTLANGSTPVAVFERDADATVRAQGYRLTIDATGSLALRTALPPALYEFIRRTSSVPGGAFVFLDHKAREMHRFKFDPAETEARGNIAGQVDRQVLRAALLSGLRDRVYFGHALSKYEESKDAVCAYFSNGFVTEGDLLVGADGTNSAVRARKLPQAAPRDTKLFAIFGRVPLVGPATDPFGNAIMALGQRGCVFFSTTMRFRERPSDVAAAMKLELTPVPEEDYLMWAVAVHATDAPNRGADGEALKALALSAVEGFDSRFRDLIAGTRSSGLIVVPVRAAPKLQHWPSSRVTLLGDAIHTMPPFGAHGANTALNDARLLATALLEHGNTQLPLRIALYEDAMRRAANAAVKSSRRMMNFATARIPFKSSVMRLAFRFVGPR